MWRMLAFPGLQMASFVAEGWSAYRGVSPYRDVPPLEPSLRVVGEAVLDRTFSLAVNLVTGVPHPATLRQGLDDALEMRAFLESHGWLGDPAGYHREPPPVEEWAISDAVCWPGPRRVRYQHLRFPSGWQPHPGEPGADVWMEREANRMMHAYVLEHSDRPRPWVVCVHGFSMGQPVVNLRAFHAARLYREMGFNVILPCLPLHGPRGGGRVSGSELLAPDYLNVIHTFAQAVWDLRRIVSWVRGRGARSIGLYGLSLGAYNSALVASLEPDLDCVIAGIPAVDFPNVARDNEPWVIRRYDDEFQIDWQVVRTITHVVSPLAFVPQLPRERRFIFAGIADRVARPDQARALWRHWDTPDIHWFSGGHVGHQWNGGIQPFVEEALYRSLEH